MNSFWPAASRLSSLRGNSSRCRPAFDSFVANLLQTSRCYTSPSRKISVTCLGYNGIRPSNPIAAFQAQRFYTTKKVITRFEDLPTNYKDEHGLAFRKKPLSDGEVKAIFGKGINVNHANRILTVLHGRRVAGTLEEPKFFPAVDTPYEAKVRQIALKWLRDKVPVDEELCAGLYAERELESMQEEIIADSERMGIYKPNAGEELKEGKKTKSIYGESVLDTIRAANEAKLNEKEKRPEESDQASEVMLNTGTLEKVSSARNGVVERKPGQNPLLKYYEQKAAATVPSSIPDMSSYERLWRSAIVVAAVVGLSVLFANAYIPPSHAARLWPDMPPAAATIISIILMNSAVLLAWRVPAAWAFLNKYFLMVPAYPRALSMVGNIFSQQSTRHFLTNMVVLWFVGTKLHDEIGRGNFLALYMCCGVLASFTSLTTFVLTGQFVTSSLGASGPIYGTLGAYLWLHRDFDFKFFGFPQDYNGIPGWVFLVGVVGWQVWGIWKRHWKIIGEDVYAHTGGLVTGIVGAQMLRKRFAVKRELEKERRSKMTLQDRIKERRV